MIEKTMVFRHEIKKNSNNALGLINTFAITGSEIIHKTEPVV